MEMKIEIRLHGYILEKISDTLECRMVDKRLEDLKMEFERNHISVIIKEMS